MKPNLFAHRSIKFTKHISRIQQQTQNPQNNSSLSQIVHEPHLQKQFHFNNISTKQITLQKHNKNIQRFQQYSTLQKQPITSQKQPQSQSLSKNHNKSTKILQKSIPLSEISQRKRKLNSINAGNFYFNKNKFESDKEDENNNGKKTKLMYKDKAKQKIYTENGYYYYEDQHKQTQSTNKYQYSPQLLKIDSQSHLIKPNLKNKTKSLHRKIILNHPHLQQSNSCIYQPGNTSQTPVDPSSQFLQPHIISLQSKKPTAQNVVVKQLQ